MGSKGKTMIENIEQLDLQNRASDHLLNGSELSQEDEDSIISSAKIYFNNEQVHGKVGMSLYLLCKKLERIITVKE